jgi:hypothetical protein
MLCRKSGLLPSPELKDTIALCIDAKTNHRQLICECLFKMLTVTGLDVKDKLSIYRRVPPISYLMRYGYFLLYRRNGNRVAVQGAANPLAIQPPFRVETISGSCPCSRDEDTP